MRKMPQQFIPLIIIFVLLITSFFVLRELLIPETFGDLGHYRAASVIDNMNMPIIYAGYEACNECHDDIYAMKAESNHRGVSCEVCHGPAALHVNEPDEYTPDAPRKRGYCPLCHGYNPARPTGFPQIIANQHNPGKPCITCHDPHKPLLPHPPGECSACHGGIAREKAVSHHMSVPCTKCHSIPNDHLTNPRFARAGKPTSKELCGQCHSRDADTPVTIPRIDLETHGERYICWECHYPHSPEANR